MKSSCGLRNHRAVCNSRRPRSQSVRRKLRARRAGI